MNQKNIALHKSLAQWAREIDSVAKTHVGQLRAISNYIAERKYESLTQRGKKTNQWVIRNYKTTQLENSADRRATILGYPDHNTAWSDYSAAYSENDARDEFVWDYINKTITVEDSLCRAYTAAWNISPTKILCAPQTVAKICWDEDTDWTNKKYPKNTYTNRRLDFFAVQDGRIAKLYSYPVDSFRGQFLRDAFLAAAQKLNLPLLRDSVISYYATKEQRRTEGREAYKIVTQVNPNDFVSIYNPHYIYRLTEKVRETAQSGHRGGLYVWATLSEAEEQLGNSEIYCNGDTILRCIVRGKTLRYNNGKIAVSELTPIAVVVRSTNQEEN